MNRLALATLVLTMATVFLVIQPVAGQTVCPPGKPSSPWPGPAFVPSRDCEGWVPKDHPLAGDDVLTPPTGIVPAAAAQDIYSALEVPRLLSAAAGGLTQIRGWVVDCPLGTFPPQFPITVTRADGFAMVVPNDFHSVFPASRPDVQAAVGGSCPAVYNVPQSDGKLIGPNDLFGFIIPLRVPIRNPGVYTITLSASWPFQKHSGATSITITIVP